MKPKVVRPLNWKDDLRKGHFVDDETLRLFYLASLGAFSNEKLTYGRFIFLHPIGWGNIDLINYLIKLSEAYNIQLSNFSTNVCAFSEDYEKSFINEETNEILPEYSKDFESYFRKQKKYEECVQKSKKNGESIFLNCFKYYNRQPVYYKGAYKWALDEIKNNTPRGILFAQVFNGNFSLEVFKKILGLHTAIISVNEPEDTEFYYQREITKSILEWTEFKLEITSEIKKKMFGDLYEYVKNFISNELDYSDRYRKFKDFSVLLTENFFSFEKHKKILKEEFSQLHFDYGNKFKFLNPYDDGFVEGVTSMEERYEKKRFLFFHSLIAFETLGLIRIRSLSSNWHYTEKEPVRALSDIELLYNPENEKLAGNELLSQWSYDDKKRCVYVSGGTINLSKAEMQHQFFSIINSFFKEELMSGKEIGLDEIAEEYNKDDVKVKPFLNAGYQINQKFLKIVKPEMFIIEKSMVKLSPEYLKST